MVTKDEWSPLLLGAAREMSQRLSVVLEDGGASSVVLTRDEAILALALIEGARDALAKEGGVLPR